MSFSFWPLDDTIDRKHLGCSGETVVMVGAGGREGGRRTTKEAVWKWHFLSLMGVQSSQRSWPSGGECLVEQQERQILCSGVTFDLSVHYWYFWQSAESWGWFYRSGAWLPLLFVFLQAVTQPFWASVFFSVKWVYLPQRDTVEKTWNNRGKTLRTVPSSKFLLNAVFDIRQNLYKNGSYVKIKREWVNTVSKQ